MKTVAKFIFATAACLGLLSGLPSKALAADLVLSAPAKSEDGSYILRLESGNFSQFDSFELYRSLNGSEYKLLVTVPLFKAISQMVNQNGIYGYKVRGIASDGSSEISEPVFVEVNSKSIRLQPQISKRYPAKSPEELTVGALN